MVHGDHFLPALDVGNQRPVGTAYNAPVPPVWRWCWTSEHRSWDRREATTDIGLCADCLEELRYD